MHPATRLIGAGVRQCRTTLSDIFSELGNLLADRADARAVVAQLAVDQRADELGGGIDLDAGTLLQHVPRRGLYNALPDVTGFVLLGLRPRLGPAEIAGQLAPADGFLPFR